MNYSLRAALLSHSTLIRFSLREQAKVIDSESAAPKCQFDVTDSIFFFHLRTHMHSTHELKHYIASFFSFLDITTATTAARDNSNKY